MVDLTRKPWYSDPDFRKTHLWWHSFYFTKHHIGDRVSTRKIVLSLKSWLLYTPSKLNEFKVQYPCKKHRKMWSALKFLLNTYTNQSRHFACVILLKSSESWQYFGETVSISTTQWLYGCFSPPNLARKHITHTHTRHIFKTPIRTVMNFSSMRAFHLNLSIEYNSSDLPKELVFFCGNSRSKKSTSWIPVAWWRHLPRNWRLTCLGTKYQSWGKVESMVERQVDYRVSGGIN